MAMFFRFRVVRKTTKPDGKGMPERFRAFGVFNENGDLRELNAALAGVPQIPTIARLRRNLESRRGRFTDDEIYLAWENGWPPDLRSFGLRKLRRALIDAGLKEAA